MRSKPRDDDILRIAAERQASVNATRKIGQRVKASLQDDSSSQTASDLKELFEWADSLAGTANRLER